MASLNSLEIQLERLEAKIDQLSNRGEMHSVSVETEIAIMKAQGIDLETELRRRSKEHTRRNARKRSVKNGKGTNKIT